MTAVATTCRPPFGAKGLSSRAWFGSDRQLWCDEISTSAVAVGSGHAGRLPRFIAEKQSLKLRFPEAADRH